MATDLPYPNAIYTRVEHLEKRVDKIEEHDLATGIAVVGERLKGIEAQARRTEKAMEARSDRMEKRNEETERRVDVLEGGEQGRASVRSWQRWALYVLGAVLALVTVAANVVVLAVTLGGGP